MPESRITVVPGLCGGRPTIRGLRITVADVLDLLAGGMSHDEILAGYPYLERDDITACLHFAAQQARREELPVPRSDAERRTILDELTREAQDLGLGY